MYTPTPFEKSYFDELFKMANTSGTPVLSGSEAVGFLSKSGLERETLRSCWAVSMSGKQEMRLPEFYILMRLVSIAQTKNKTALTPQLIIETQAQTLPLPRFANIPIPTQPQQQSTTPPLAVATANTTSHSSIDPTEQQGFAMSANDKAFYTRAFNTVQHPNGVVPGPQAATFLAKSKVEQDNLRKIWALSDIDKDGGLNLEEFCIAMHLCVCVSRRRLTLPPVLPKELQPMPSTPSVPSPSGMASSSGMAATAGGVSGVAVLGSSDGVESKVDDVGAKLMEHLDAAKERTTQATAKLSDELEVLTERKSELLNELDKRESELSKETEILKSIESEVLRLRVQVNELQHKIIDTRSKTLDVKESALLQMSEKNELEKEMSKLQNTAQAPRVQDPTMQQPQSSFIDPTLPMSAQVSQVTLQDSSTNGITKTASVEAPKRPAPTLNNTTPAAPKTNSAASGVGSSGNILGGNGDEFEDPWASLDLGGTESDWTNMTPAENNK